MTKQARHRLGFTKLEERSMMAANIFGAAAGYNAFFFNDINVHYSDIQGKLAVGGNATLEGYSVGDKVSGIGPELVVGGNLKFTNGQVDGGDVAVGGTTTTKWFGTNGGKLEQKTGVVNFASLKTSLTTMSDQLAGLASTGVVENRYGGLFLTGTNAKRNIFNIDAADLDAAWGITIDAPAGSTVIVNVHGSSARMDYMGYQLTGGVDGQHVLLNFADAQSLVLEGVGIFGSILAPRASVNFNNGQVNGNFVASSFCGYGQINHLPTKVETPFCGCQNRPTTDTPTPTVAPAPVAPVDEVKPVAVTPEIVKKPAVETPIETPALVVETPAVVAPPVVDPAPVVVAPVAETKPVVVPVEETVIVTPATPAPVVSGSRSRVRYAL